MRDEILEICAETLRGEGHAAATGATLFEDRVLAAAAAALLRDCRPMPVIVDLIADLEAVAKK
jgi:hypothetical protein